MSKQDQVNEDVARVAHAVKQLRERYSVTQDHAAEAHPRKITKQYWSMHETGQVPGIVKPATQRELLAAISKAAELDEPLTLEDLSDAMSPSAANPQDARALRMARSFGAARGAGAAAPSPSAAPAGRQAIFPLSTGDVVVQLPATMTPEAYQELEAYLAVFLKTRAPKD